MQTRVNSELIDQLVCGSLSGAEYRRAILALESDPQRWRDCALAFLQEQAIALELQQLSQSSVQWEVRPSSTPAQTLVATVISDRSAAKRTKDFGWVYKLGTLAALLMVSFSVGWFGSSIRSNAVQAGSEIPTSPQMANLPRQGRPDYKVDQMLVEEIPNSTPDDCNNYNFIGNSNKSLIPIDQQIPASLARLEREGRIRIETSTALVPVDFEGGTALVPMQQIHVVPVTYSY